MIVAVASGKGGVGKTTVSFNLARELGGVVVDGDLATGTLPRGTGPNFHDVLAGRIEPTEAVQPRSDMYVLPVGESLAGARAADMERFGPIMEALQREYGSVIIDCPPGLARDVGIQLASADLSVIVTTPDRVAIEAAQRTQTLSARLDRPVAAIVLNRATGTEPKELFDEIEATLGANVISLSSRVELTSAQEYDQPLRDAYPDSPALAPFEELAQQLRDAMGRLE